jgi:NADPH:quinone reductase-like Zn-dependent oxidoreductase
MGARVFAVASGDDGVALAKRLGADAVAEGHKEDMLAVARAFAPDGIDCALITAGGEAADRALQSVRDGGRVAHPNGVEPAPKARPGIAVKSYDGTPGPELIRKLNQLIEAGGAFEVHVARTFRLDEADEALRALDGHFLGKIALRPN